MRGMNRPIQTVITGPQQPPVSVEYARRHIKALMHSDDVMIAMWIDAARSFFEEITGRQIITATREIWLDAFPTGTCKIELPKPPLQDVVSVLYVAGDGTVTSFDDASSPATVLWQAKAPQGEYAGPGWIEPVYGSQWPTARAEGGAVRIQYTCGYGDDETDVPPLVTGALCYLIANYDLFRTPSTEAKLNDVPYGIRAILDGFRYSSLPTTAYAKTWWPQDGVAWV